jgi:hypothetical protein
MSSASVKQPGATDLWQRKSGPLVVGMVHLLPLPGSPQFGGDMQAVHDAARRDALALAEGGVHAIIGTREGNGQAGGVSVHVSAAARPSFLVARFRGFAGARPSGCIRVPPPACGFASEVLRGPAFTCRGCPKLGVISRD